MKRQKHVYFIKPVGVDGPIKIGVSTRTRLRLRDMQATSPLPLELVAHLPGTNRTERFLHARFGDLRLHGEWFECDDGLRQAIQDAVDGVADYAFAERNPLRHWLDRARLKRHLVLSIGHTSYQDGVFA